MMKWWLAENERDEPWTVYSLGRTIDAEGENKASRKKIQSKL